MSRKNGPNRRRTSSAGRRKKKVESKSQEKYMLAQQELQNTLHDKCFLEQDILEIKKKIKDKEKLEELSANNNWEWDTEPGN